MITSKSLSFTWESAERSDELQDPLPYWSLEIETVAAGARVGEIHSVGLHRIDTIVACGPKPDVLNEAFSRKRAPYGSWYALDP